MGLDPGCAPASRSRSSTPPASCSPPTPSIRSSRATTSAARRRRSRALIARHGVELDRHRQRHRQPRDRAARRRPARRCCPARSRPGRRRHEAGASVYSASELAREEFPDLDVTAARRGLHRPPPAGPARRAGQDRPQGDRRRPVPARRRPAPRSAASLEEVVETRSTPSASSSTPPRAPLLAYVSGLGPTLAEAIVAHRDANGRLPQPRASCSKVARPRAAGLRAGRRLPAHPRRRRAARRLRGPPRALRRRRRMVADLRPRPARADGRRGTRCAPSTRADFVDATLRPADAAGHPRRAGQARPRPAPGLRHRQLRRGRRGRSPT